MSDPSNGHPRDLLSEYLDDELGLEERASVDRHLAGCEDCRQELEALRRLARALSEERVPPVPDDLVERIGRRLDTATIVRPQRWRFALPATIAATVGAIGLLVVLQWRDGRVTMPSAPVPELSAAKPSYAPAPPVLPEQGMASPRDRADARTVLEKDLAAAPEQKPMEDSESAPEGAPGGVPGGVIGGVVGGVEGGVPGGSATPQVTAADERRERAAAKVAIAAPERAQPSPLAPMANSEIQSVCGQQWSDSGVYGTWDVEDVRTELEALDQMAHDVGGVGVWRGVTDGGPYVLVVPRGRFEEVFFALRARGVAGLVEPPAVAAGSDCAGISITLAVAAGAAPPPPR